MLQAKKYAETIKKFLPNSKDLSILDFGCGTGLLSFSFAAEARELIGIDTSEKMLEVFQEKAKTNRGLMHAKGQLY